MSEVRTVKRAVAVGILAAGLWALPVGIAFAHCDSTHGPVIPEAKASLESGDLTPILKWVREEDEAEIEAAFNKALAVRAKGPEARELADRYFLETLIRLHRAGEGAPFTGITDDPVDPVVAMADEALAEGSAEEMIKEVSAHMAEAIRERLERAVAAGKKKDESVAAGREFVEAYVTYVHYVEGIHNSIVSAGGHHAEAGVGAGGQGD